MSYINEAPWDRILRILVGVAMIYVGWADLLPGLWSAAARIFGVIPLLTGLTGWSPLYALLGWRTTRQFTAPPASRSGGERQ